jgi:hypothetical protein
MTPEQYKEAAEERARKMLRKVTVQKKSNLITATSMQKRGVMRTERNY